MAETNQTASTTPEKHIQRLASALQAMVDAYWGEGDGDPENPPSVVVEAKAALAALRVEA